MAMKRQRSSSSSSFGGLAGRPLPGPQLMASLSRQEEEEESGMDFKAISANSAAMFEQVQKSRFGAATDTAVQDSLGMFMDADILNGSGDEGDVGLGGDCDDLDPSQQAAMRAFGFKQSVVMLESAPSNAGQEVIDLLVEHMTFDRVSFVEVTDGSSFSSGALTVAAMFCINAPVRMSAANQYLLNIQKLPAVKSRIRALKVIVIRNIDRISASELNVMNHMLINVRQTEVPFGGVQVLCAANALAIRPVNQTESSIQSETFSHMFKWFDFVESDAHVSEATAAVCDQVATGHLSARARDALTARSAPGPLAATNELRPHIFVNPVDASNVNKLRMGELKTDLFAFKYAMKHTLSNQDIMDVMRVEAAKVLPFRGQLYIKVGAHVMLTMDLCDKNGQHGTFRKGMLGIVTDVVDSGTGNYRPVVQFEDLDDPVSISSESAAWDMGKDGRYEVCALPLKLAFALGTNELRNVTLARAHIDCKQAFGEGGFYMSLTRVRDIDNVTLSDFSPEVISANRDNVTYVQNLRSYLDNLTQ